MHKLTLTFLFLCANHVSCQFYSLNLDSGPNLNSCIIIPKEKIWPFSTSDHPKNAKFPGMPDNAKRACNKLGMSLAKITSPTENTALLRWKGKLDI